MTQKKQSSEAAKPFMTGSQTDENTFRQALKFFGILCIMMFMTFLVCSMTGFKSPILRAIVNISIELLILFIFYTKGIELGHLGQKIHDEFPTFNVKEFGYSTLSKFIYGIKDLKVENSGNNNIKVYIR